MTLRARPFEAWKIEQHKVRLARPRQFDRLYSSSCFPDNGEPPQPILGQRERDEAAQRRDVIGQGDTDERGLWLHCFVDVKARAKVIEIARNKSATIPLAKHPIGQVSIMRDLLCVSSD